jgi:hypothetical protein
MENVKKARDSGLFVDAEANPDAAPGHNVQRARTPTPKHRKRPLLRRVSHSRVRAIYDDCTTMRGRADDGMIIENVRAFLATGATPSRRAYRAWPGRSIGAATVENHYGSWPQAVAPASGTASRVQPGDSTGQQP